MKLGSRVALIIGGLVSMSITGCGRRASLIEIDGHVFRVPREHIVTETIPWLPANQSAGLKFIVNPASKPEEQLLVAIEPVKTTCQPKTRPTSNQLASACLAAERNHKESAEPEFNIEKISPGGDPTQWEYRLKGQETVVASCSALSGGRQLGLCRALGNYKDLVYSVGFRDSEISRLRAIQTKVHELLAAWESH